MINAIKKIKSQQGQIAIVVLLVSAVLLTLGISVSKKTVTDTKVDTDEELLKEAFNTAESGINNYLNDSSKKTFDAGNGNQAVVETENIGGNNSSLSSEGLVSKNTPYMFWLVDHNPTDGNLGTQYYISQPASANINVSVEPKSGAALKIDYFYKDGTGSHVQRSFLRCDNNNARVSTFTLTDCTKAISLSLPGNSLLISITPIDFETPLTISGSSNFPIQGETITSVGTVTGGVKTQVKTRYVYQIPTFMLESITARNIVQ